MAALGLFLITTPFASRTITKTTTVMLSQQDASVVENSFADHLVAFASRNVSAFASQYEPRGNLTWEKILCLTGEYSNGAQNGTINLLLNIVFGYHPVSSRFSGFHSVYVGNITKLSTAISDGASPTATVNSTFTLDMRGPGGNLTATVSSSDTYVQSKGGAWMISQETWIFTTGANGLSALGCYF